MVVGFAEIEADGAGGGGGGACGAGAGFFFPQPAINTSAAVALIAHLRTFFAVITCTILPKICKRPIGPNHSSYYLKLQFGC
jgi:hypothetical protein